MPTAHGPPTGTACPAANRDADADRRRRHHRLDPHREPQRHRGAASAHRREHGIRLVLGGARVGVTTVGPQRHRALGLRGDGERRVDAEVGRDGRAVDDRDAGVAPHPVVAVDDSALGRRPDGRPRRGSARSSARRTPRTTTRRPRCSRRWPRRAASRAPAWPRGPAGMYVGFGCPWPCREVRPGRPSSPRLPDTCSELSRLCMTRPMIIRSLQCRGIGISRRKPIGSRPTLRSSSTHRGRPVPPGTAMVASRPMAFEPLP